MRRLHSSEDVIEDEPWLIIKSFFSASNAFPNELFTKNVLMNKINTRIISYLHLNDQVK
jgi:hypothetical protein